MALCNIMNHELTRIFLAFHFFCNDILCAQHVLCDPVIFRLLQYEVVTWIVTLLMRKFLLCFSHQTHQLALFFLRLSNTHLFSLQQHHPDKNPSNENKFMKISSTPVFFVHPLRMPLPKLRHSHHHHQLLLRSRHIQKL